MKSTSEYGKLAETNFSNTPVRRCHGLYSRSHDAVRLRLHFLKAQRMGAHPWYYSVPYVEDIAGALSALREREFRAGRYRPAEMFPRFPVDANHTPGCRHVSMEAARQAAGASGTRSIVDILRLGDRPDFGVASSLLDDELEDLFGTKTPSAEEILDCDELFDQIERGHGVYVTAYEDGKPAEIIFLGYSYD